VAAAPIQETRSDETMHAGKRHTTMLMLVLLGTAMIVTAVVLLPGLLVPSDQVLDPVHRLELQNEVRSTLLQGLGGVLLVAGAYFTWRQLDLNRAQLNHTLQVSEATSRLSNETMLNEMFRGALENLGHDKPGVRIGAIYAFEHVAKASDKLRQGIHELLAGYVRAQSQWKHHDSSTYTAVDDPAEDEPAQDELPLLKVRAPDVQAALTVLGRRSELLDEVVELQSADLRFCYLGGANLRRAIISRAMAASADFSGCNLAEAWLRRSNFRDAKFVNADLRGATLCDAILVGADFSGADLAGAVLTNAVFDDATRWPSGFTLHTEAVHLTDSIYSMRRDAVPADDASG